MFELSEHGFKAWRTDPAGRHGIFVKANENDWDSVERILRAHAPGARRINRF